MNLLQDIHYILKNDLKSTGGHFQPTEGDEDSLERSRNQNSSSQGRPGECSIQAQVTQLIVASSLCRAPRRDL
ncbi:Inactive serine/threonine-protein kinase TEX14 [Manis javanica]|nr:Inactive serine/threonine-protein kinase TEX14 [Manis javanica]